MNDKEFLLKVGRNIAEMRKSRRLSQSQLGALINIERNNISNIENGKHNLTTLTLYKFAKAFDCAPYEILMVE